MPKTRLPTSPMDRWFVTEIRPIRDDDVAGCLKHLEKLVQGDVVGSADGFLDSSLFYCAHAGAQIARNLTADPKAHLEYRLRAMSYLICLSPWSVAIERDIDLSLLKTLLRAKLRDNSQRLQLLKLCLTLLTRPQLWRAVKDDALVGLQPVMNADDRSAPPRTQRALKAALCAAYNRLLIVISTPPPGVQL